MSGTRKLPRSMRMANFIYQILTACLAGINLIFSTLSFVPIQYFEVVSVIASVFPVIWTHILDACKQYINDTTPASTQPSSPRSDIELDNTKINNLLEQSIPPSIRSSVPRLDTREYSPQVEQSSLSSEHTSPAP